MDKRTIKRHLNALAKKDKHVADALVKVGYPEPRQRPVGFEAFLGTIISQQISNRAADTIKGRVFALLPELHAQAFMAVSDEDLRAAGMSQRKLEYARGLASAIIQGEFDPDGLNELNDEEAIAQIVKLRGFGVWTAEIYLMLSLGRTDVFPADDLIIRASLKKLKRKRAELTAQKAREVAKHWSPYRSVGCLFLWHVYHYAQVNKKNK